MEPKLLGSIKSTSRSHIKYEIRQGKDGVIYCSCMAWKMHKNCKHLQEWRATSGYRAGHGFKPAAPWSTEDLTNLMKATAEEIYKHEEDQIIDLGDYIKSIYRGITTGKWKGEQNEL